MIKQRKKGVSVLIWHSLAIAISLTIVIIIISSLSTVRTDFENFVIDEEIKQVCQIAKTGVERIYHPSSYTSRTNTTMASIILSMPDEISEAKYRATFINRSLYVEAFGKNKNYTCNMGFNITFFGSTGGGETELIWTRFDNATDRIEMRPEVGA